MQRRLWYGEETSADAVRWNKDANACAVEIVLATLAVSEMLQTQWSSEETSANVVRWDRDADAVEIVLSNLSVSEYEEHGKSPSLSGIGSPGVQSEQHQQQSASEGYGRLLESIVQIHLVELSATPRDCKTPCQVACEVAERAFITNGEDDTKRAKRR